MASLDFLIIVASSFFFFMNFSQLMLLPKFIVHLGLSPADIGMLMGAFSIAVLASLPFMGRVSRKIPKKAMFIAGSGMMCLATPAYALVEGMGPLIFILRIVQGVGFSSAFGVMGALVYEVPGERSGRYLLGVLTAVNITTHAIGPAFGEFVIGAGGFEPYFLTAGAFGFMGLVMGFFLPGKTIANPDGQDGTPGSLKGAAPHMAGSLILGAVFGSCVIFIPPLLLTRGIENSGYFFVSFVLGSLMVWSFLHRLFAGLGDRRSLFLSIIFMICLPLGISLPAGYAGLCALSLAFGIGYGYLYPALNALFIDACPGLKVKANSFFVWWFNLGMAAASLGFGALSALWGYDRAFVMAGILGFSMTMLVTRLEESRGPR